MPTQRFYKLSEDKRERIHQAAYNEFVRVAYRDASINQIVKDADISRGSFYTYFEDKMDVLTYLLEDFGNCFRDYCKKMLKKHNGDIFAMFKELYSWLCDLCSEERHYYFYKNVFSDMNMISMSDHDSRRLFPKDRLDDFIHDLYDNTDHRLVKLSKSDFKPIMEICFMIVMRAAVDYKFYKKNEQDTLHTMNVQMDIIYKGVTA